MELIIEKAKTCCFSGHRSVENQLNKENLKEKIMSLINAKYDTFLVGMAIGFDTICFQVLEEIRREHKIKIIGCIPCPNQSYNFSVEQKKEYDRMLESADESLIISPNYNKLCMKKRNDFMVNSSSAIIVYLRRDFGGTFYTYNKAKKEKLNVILV